MKNISKQAWFVPAVIAVAIVGTLTLYRNKDSLFGNSNEYGLTYIDMEKADDMMSNPEKYDNGNFIIVYGNEDCGACKTLYGEIKIFRNSQSEQAKKYKFYNIDTKATPDKSSGFWNDWIAGQSKFTWGAKAADGKFESVSTPVSILVKDGDTDNRYSYSGSSNATTINEDIKNNHM